MDSNFKSLIVSLLFSVFSGDNVDKTKEKRPIAGSTAGQMLPVILDKSSHVTQVQGSRQDQIGKVVIIIVTV